ncbi:hypothetical protein [Pedobacter aquatilis]|uniref:hypothetical protein n=1 Tax=Pedobacter aquatilis TaxID=351343 RepID=UPI00293155B8|nr:hypothetical protein [Pedobacter aquatilis]
MRNFTLNYHKNLLLLAVMITIPLVGAMLLLAILLFLPKASFGIINISAIALSIILVATALYWMIDKQIFVPCEVLLSKNGINFKLGKKSIFYNQYDFFFEWENVRGISEVFCSATGKYFYRIKFTNPNITADFSPQNNKETEADAFFSELDSFKEALMISESKKLKPHFKF